MVWMEVLFFAGVIGLSLWASGWLKRRPELTLRQVLGRLTVGVVALVCAVVALWAIRPGVEDEQEGGLVGGGIFLLLSLLREVPAVRALPLWRRWGLYVLAAWSLPVVVALALGALHPTAPGEAMLEFLGLASQTLLVLTPAALLGAGVWHCFGRGRVLVLPGPDEAPTPRR